MLDFPSTGLVAGVTTVTGPSGQEWMWDGVKWKAVGGGGGPAITLPLSIAQGGTGQTTATLARQYLGVANFTIPFVIPGKPPAAQKYHFRATFAYALATGVGYCTTPAAGGTAAIFVINKLTGASSGSAGNVTQIGTLTMPSGNYLLAINLVSPPVTIASGDVLQVVAPDPQDSALADIGISFGANRTTPA